MSIKTPPSDLPIHPFSSANDFEDFLQNEHTSAPGIYLKLARKSSGIASVSASEAVEVALCFGWIDGRANNLDEKWWVVRYTPRRSKSIWSQKNVNTIARLTKEGRMRAAGLAAVEAAKADGRWERAYAGPATATVPADLAVALEKNPVAARFFESVNRKHRYSVLWRVETASAKSRAKRIETLVQMLSEGKIPGESAPVSKTTNAGDSSQKKAATKRVAAAKPRPVKKQPKSRSAVPTNDPNPPRRPGLRQRP